MNVQEFLKQFEGCLDVDVKVQAADGSKHEPVVQVEYGQKELLISAQTNAASAT
jgi:hypothetical protein